MIAVPSESTRTAPGPSSDTFPTKVDPVMLSCEEEGYIGPCAPPNLPWLPA